MKWCVSLVFILTLSTLSAIAAVNQNQSSQERNVQEDESKIFENDFGSIQQTSELFGEFREEEKKDAVRIMSRKETPDNLTGESMPFFLKSTLDVFNPHKLDSFLKEKGSEVSDVCSKKLAQYLTGLKEGQSWAVKSKL